MKKYYFLFACLLSFLTCVYLSSCGGSSSQPGLSVQSQSGLSVQSYRDAVKNLDFETARDVLYAYREEYTQACAKCSGKNILWSEDKQELKTAESAYFNAFDYIYKAEVQYLLSELSEDECLDKITFLLEEIPVEGEKYPQGLCSYQVVERSEHGQGVTLDAYIVWTQHYNNLCENILSLAINRKNKALAEGILNSFVDNVELFVGATHVEVDGVKVDGDHGYIKYVSTDRDAAQERYSKAVAQGAFN